LYAGKYVFEFLQVFRKQVFSMYFGRIIIKKSCVNERIVQKSILTSHILELILVYFIYKTTHNVYSIN